MFSRLVEMTFGPVHASYNQPKCKLWNWLSLHPAFQEKQTAHYHYTTILEHWQSNHNLLVLYALLLKDLCHKIYQNSGKNRHQIQWIIKTTAQTMKRRDKNNNTANKYKRRHAWTYFNEIETDCSWVFGKLVSIMVFRSSFLLLNSYIWSKKSKKLRSCHSEVIPQLS